MQRKDNITSPATSLPYIPPLIGSSNTANPATSPSAPTSPLSASTTLTHRRHLSNNISSVTPIPQTPVAPPPLSSMASIHSPTTNPQQRQVSSSVLSSSSNLSARVSSGNRPTSPLPASIIGDGVANGGGIITSSIKSEVTTATTSALLSGKVGEGGAAAQTSPDTIVSSSSSPPPTAATAASVGLNGHGVAQNSPPLSPAARLDDINAFMDRQCKWIVSTIVFGVCLGNTYVNARTVVVPYFILCALGTAMAGKGLKRLLKQPRPAGAVKSDHGMPSSHAVSLGFLSTALCVSSFVQIYYYPNNFTSSGAFFIVLECLLAQASGVYFSLLRIRHGHHTLAQVCVGYAFGLSCCVVAALANYGGWSPQGAVWSPNLAPKVASHHVGGRVDDERYVSEIQRVYINAVFVMSSVGFAVRYVRRWLGEKSTSLARKPAQNELFSPTTANPSFLNLQPPVDGAREMAGATQQ